MKKDYNKKCKKCKQSPIRNKSVVKSMHHIHLKDKCMTCGEEQ